MSEAEELLMKFSAPRCAECGRLFVVETIESSASPACYKAGTDVKHLATGNIYHVLAAPDDRSRLEYCNEPYYRYKDSGGVEWVRRQSEMEDGRFEAL